MGGQPSKFNDQNNESFEMNQVFKDPSKEQDEEKEKKKKADNIICPGEIENEQNEEKPEQASGLRRILTIVVIILILAESIYSTYAAWEAYNGFGNLSDQLKTEVTDRYGLRMIQDIKVDRACNGEYEAMFVYVFKGTNNRCDCRKQGGDITVGFCTNDEQNCRYIGFINELVLSVYPFGTSDKLDAQLCMKTYTKNTFQSITDWPKKCRSGYQMCGGQSVESMLCMPEGEQCPINSLIVSLTNPDPTIYDESIIFNSTHTLFYTRKSDNLPLNYALVTSGEGPCYDMFKENTYDGRVDHFTFKLQRQVCEVDKRWQRLAEVGEYTFYKSDGIVPEEYFKEIWDEYPISDTYRYGFYISHYPQWKYAKRNLMETITVFVEKREFIMQYQIILLGLNAAALAMNVFIGLKIFHLQMKSADEKTKEEFERRKNIFINMIKILQIGACIYQVIAIKDYVNAFNECVQFQVSDERVNGILKLIGNYLDEKVFVADKKLIISNCLGFAVTLLLLIYTQITNKKKTL